MSKTVTAEPVEIGAKGTVPEWVELIADTPVLRGRDDRRFVNDDPARVVEAFRREGRALVLDWGHGSVRKGAKGERAAAAGWIEDLERRGGGVWGRVVWTPQGRRDMETRAYRYLSLAFNIDGARQRILSLDSAGLTHAPNLQLKALNMEQDIPTPLMSIAAALGLEDTVDAPAIVEAITALKGAATLAVNRAAPAAGEMVPRADYELAIERLRHFEAVEAARREAEIVEAVDNAICIGDPAFPPAQRETYLVICRQEGGLERFREIVRPDIARSLNRAAITGDPPRTRRPVRGESERGIYATLGLDLDAA